MFVRPWPEPAPLRLDNPRRDDRDLKMTHQRQINHLTNNLLPIHDKEFDLLAELALDLRWSWNHSADEVWRQMDPSLWDLTHNPWVILQSISKDQFEKVAADPIFCKRVKELIRDRRQEAQAPAWFQQTHPDSPLTGIAYFSMEFMLSEALPIYSGGLGNVAGDQLKSASDLGVPVTGIGLLYQQGYFRQVIDKDGNQLALYPYNDPGQLPITPLRTDTGEWLRLEIPFPGYSVWLRTWQVQVGRVRLLLLDSNDAANTPANRGITSELYGGGPEIRLKQEMVLGIGGWRLLRALGMKPEVCHLNEGHAAFAVLERALSFMEDTGQSFEVALVVTRAGNLFTTHTAVAAGFDRFEPNLIQQYLGGYAEKKLKISFHDLMTLGRQNPNDTTESFNMAFLAIHGSGAVNGVSRLHQTVSQRLFEPLFPRWPQEEIPVGYVTNGVHTPSWDSAASDNLWTEACGKNRWRSPLNKLDQNIRFISDEEIWKFRTASSSSFVDYLREQFTLQQTAAGVSPEAVLEAKMIFNPHALTLGFARRFATYKRPNLLLHDPERLVRLLSNPEWPVQLVLAGKSHPADLAGQALIRDWIHFIQRPEVRPHVVFLNDYDMLLTEHLVQGVDVWINTPRRPWEACGTSGMKVLVNGGINVSELDGWWAEAYTPEVGWAIGDGQEHDDDPFWDAQEAEMLYDILEHQVIPEFYDRNNQNIPVGWVARMRESMARLTTQFSSNRAVFDYTEQRYLPAAAAYLDRAANQGEAGVKFINWQYKLKKEWPNLHFGEMKVVSTDDHHVFEVGVFLGNLNPEDLRVELFANSTQVDESEGIEMKLSSQSTDPQNPVYQAQILATRPAADYTARVIPQFAGITVPLEVSQILWQR